MPTWIDPHPSSGQAFLLARRRSTKPPGTAARSIARIIIALPPISRIVGASLLMRAAIRIPDGSSTVQIWLAVDADT